MGAYAACEPSSTVIWQRKDLRLLDSSNAQLPLRADLDYYFDKFRQRITTNSLDAFN